MTGRRLRAIPTAVAAVAAVATLLTACSSATKSSSSDSAASGSGASSGSLTKLTVGIPANSAAAAFIQLAVEAGLTTAAGLDVTLNSNLPPANTPAALVSGSIQASALTSAATQASSKGIPVINVLATASHAPFVMVAGPGISSLSQLAGKKVVTSAATDTPGTETKEILTNAGIADQVKVIPVGTVPGRSALFVSKQADAIYEALNLALQDAAKRPGSTIIADNSSIPSTPSDGLAFTTSYLKKNRATALALVTACMQAANMIKNQPATASPHLMKIYNLTSDEVGQFIKYQKDSIVISGVPSQTSFDNQAALFKSQAGSDSKVDWTSDLVAKSWDTSVATDAAKTLNYS
ncbi:ABC transporter substrate-binding protein [Jatrophihabitans sp. DSM 45814]